jgi:hypothetical protein
MDDNKPQKEMPKAVVLTLTEDDKDIWEYLQGRKLTPRESDSYTLNVIVRGSMKDQG